MNKILLLLAVISISAKLFAQVPQGGARPVPPPLPSREVSGVVKDSTDNTIPGASVTLTSAKDTLKTTTNADGIFVFRNVKVATFFLTVSSLGYKTQTAKRLENDAVARLVLSPVVLKNDSRILNEVVVNGTPSIIYKTDTVEYRASDYKVRANATVDELLKKMEGFEVASDGSVTHMGQAVASAKLNGKTISGGDVASTIQSLPADIVERIQVVDDYGNEAARTGVKSGDPSKVLNITTKADRSIGNMARINTGAGSKERYNAQANLTRLNANQTIQVNGNINNTVNGVSSTGGAQAGASTQGGGVPAGAMITGGGGGQAGGGGGARTGGTGTTASANTSSGTGGTTNTGSPSFTYRDDWGKRVNVNMNYSYRYTNRNTFSSSEAQQFSTLGTTFSNNETSGDNNNKNHTFSMDLEYEVDSANFLRFSPSLSYTSSLARSTSAILQTGLIHQANRGGNSTSNTAPNLSGSVFYQHSFKNARRNFSLNLSNTYADGNTDREQNSHIVYYDKITENILKDSLIHRLVENGNLNKTYRGSATYVEPLTIKTQLEFNGQVNYRGYDNTALTGNISSNGTYKPIDSLSNIFNYSFTETRLALNYRFGIRQADKIKFSLGATAVPSVLAGTKVNLNVTTRRARLNFIPIARFQYQWTRQKQFALNYAGSFTEPTFDQIQPVRDVSDPQNPVVGNPDLKASFRSAVSASFNNYIANSRLNYSANVNTTFTNNSVASNTVQIPDAYGSFKNERRYLNLNGAYAVNGNYNVSKQLANRKYNVSLNGTLGYTHNVAMSNNSLYTANTWRLNERFGPRINPTEWFEINPNVSFDFTKTNYTLPGLSNRLTKTLAFNIDGRIDFLKTFVMGYNASKNYISGINTNISTNPFIINGYIEKNLFAKKNATLRLQAYDLLNQNNFINRTITDTGITDTKTNALSRYLMVSFRVNLQKWTGTPTRNGLPMQRRGDGSFINN